MTKATASPKVDRTIQLRDGRQMAFCEWGDLRGRPVVLLHGMPGSRLFCPDEEATEAAGVRLLTMDRPGYGRSDPRPDRTLLDWADDYIELASQLDLPPCPVLGWSSGGPYALALGFRAPARVPTIGLAASDGPTDQVPGALDAYSPNGRAAAELVARDRAAGVVAFNKHCAWYAGDGWQTMFAASWGEADDRVLAGLGTLEAMKQWIREGARQGSAGYAADAIAQSLPWGFSVAEIRQPAYVWWGESDPNVGRAHTDYLAESIPRAILVTYPSEGHLFPISHWGEMLAALR
jgi:pimeloyl-ACP methyl ester carboxylesterase